ncbi:MAG: phenylalanine--tRNA ligase subunit beta [Minisyncoccales bacterium]
MLFSYNWLQSFFEKKLPEPKVLADLIIRHSFEVEAIRKKGKDAIFDISILSNRPDCFAHIGIAREIGAILGRKLILPKTKADKMKNAIAAKTLADVKIENPEACRRYTAMIVSGVKIGPSPKWMRERLEACGMRAINNVVDATNYVLLETGQPLHAFDWDKLQNSGSKTKAKKIIVRFARNGETIDALTGKKYELDSKTLVISDETGPLAVAGIKGGRRAEISEKTVAIVIESANFDRRSVRAASRRLGLQTDASLRFEHDLDPAQTAEVARRAAELIAQISGGQVLAGAVDCYPAPAKPKKIILEMENAEKLLGIQLQTARVKKILESLGFSVRKGKGLSLEVASPTRRTDVFAPQDLIEEIGRIGGYEAIDPELPAATIAPPAENYFWRWKNITKDALTAAGWTETRNSTFISAADCRNFDFRENDVLEIKNPVNADLRFMRPSLLPGLLKNAAANSQTEILRQFEIGRIFAPDLRMEPTMLSGFDRGGSFFEAKGALEFVCRKLGIADFRCVPLGDRVDSLFDPARSARVFANGKEIGIIGQLTAAVGAALGLGPLAVFEISLDVLSVMATRKIEYKRLSIYPEAIRDISVDMPIQTFSGDVMAAVKAADNLKLIKSFEISGAPYISGKNKNILFKFHLHSDQKTLDSKEIGDWQEKTIVAIEKNPEWRVKK